MKRRGNWAALGLAAMLAAGCENTTTTTGSTPAGSVGVKPTVTRLTITSAIQRTIRRGDSDEVAIKINRDKFNAPITIRLQNLPQGVTCVEDEVVAPAGATEVTLTLKADQDAAVGKFKVKVDAQAPGIDANSHFFDLNVIDNT